MNLDLGEKPDGQLHDFTAANRPFPHPVYGAQGSVCLINLGQSCSTATHAGSACPRPARQATR
ncbi:MAG: DUF6194 family protein [Archangium sp.]